MRILIVDNHKTECERLVRFLEKMDDVDIVGISATCSDAIEKSKNLKPDLIISEVKLPDGNYLDVMQDILSFLPEVKIVILTADESEDVLLQAIQNGARGYLIKDAKSEKMLASLYELSQNEFIVSPRMAQIILTNYSRIRFAISQQLNKVPLTERERDVLRLVCIGSSNREIANNLVISENTVRVHLQSIFKKLSLKNRREAREKYRLIFPKNGSRNDLLFQPAAGLEYHDLRSNDKPIEDVN